MLMLCMVVINVKSGKWPSLCSLLDSVGGRHGGLIVSVLDSESSGPGSSPGHGLHCVLGEDTLPT